MRMILRSLILTLALAPSLAVQSFAGTSNTGEGVPETSDPAIEDDDADSARPAWADPNAEPPPVGVDDDPTPFDPAERPPDPDPD